MDPVTGGATVADLMPPILSPAAEPKVWPHGARASLAALPSDTLPQGLAHGPGCAEAFTRASSLRRMHRRRPSRERSKRLSLERGGAHNSADMSGKRPRAAPLLNVCRGSGKQIYPLR